MEKDELIYQFHDTGLLTTAMTIPSYANDIAISISKTTNAWSFLAIPYWVWYRQIMYFTVTRMYRRDS